MDKVQKSQPDLTFFVVDFIISRNEKVFEIIEKRDRPYEEPVSIKQITEQQQDFLILLLT